MPIIHLLTIALVQGITEFLPISSSAHLVLIPIFTGWPDHGLLLDISVHVGTLGAVIVYCWRDLFQILVGLIKAISGKPSPHMKLLVLILVSTIPALVVGFFLNQQYPHGIRNLEVIGWATLIFGLFLYFSDQVGMTIRRIEHIKFPDAIAIGIAQILALIPGTSRAGITISIARLLGIERKDAARFSILLSIPIIAAAGGLKAFELYSTGTTEITKAAIIACSIAFLFALATISTLMLWLQKSSFTPFVIYRVILGTFILAVAYN